MSGSQAYTPGSEEEDNELNEYKKGGKGVGSALIILLKTTANVLNGLERLWNEIAQFLQKIMGNQCGLSAIETIKSHVI